LNKHGTQAQKFKRRMEPGIQVVDRFISTNGRCPDFHELNDLVDGMRGIFSLRFDTDYVRDLGGNKPNDYVLACWVGEWHHCYRSWDQGFYNEYPNFQKH